MLKANDVLLYWFRCNPPFSGLLDTGMDHETLCSRSYLYPGGLRLGGLLKFGLLHINVTLHFYGQSHQSGACYISSIQKLVSEGRHIQLSTGRWRPYVETSYDKCSDPDGPFALFSILSDTMRCFIGLMNTVFRSQARDTENRLSWPVGMSRTGLIDNCISKLVCLDFSPAHTGGTFTWVCMFL